VELRFSKEEVPELAKQYEIGIREPERQQTLTIIRAIFPSYRLKGFLTKNEFLQVCEWKTRRSKSRCASNDEEFIREISALVLATNSERLRIQAWTLLAGVQWPTASVFLHFAFENQYPILDFRALWSLGLHEPPPYDFPFWWKYTCFCRELANDAGVNMRLLDQALWQHSKLYQRVRSHNVEGSPSNA